MADRIIKPDSGNVLELQDAGGTARIEINDGGTTLLKDEGGTTAISIAAAGDVSVTEDVIIGDSKYIGSSSGPTAIQIDASGNVKLSVGNLIIGTGGKGIDFSQAQTPAAGMTAEILDSYEEGTWNASFSNENTDSGTYTKIGRLVFCTAYLTTTGSGAAGVTIGGLPFTSAAATDTVTGGVAVFQTADTAHTITVKINENNTSFKFLLAATDKELAANKTAYLSVTYITA